MNRVALRSLRGPARVLRSSRVYVQLLGPSVANVGDSPSLYRWLAKYPEIRAVVDHRRALTARQLSTGTAISRPASAQLAIRGRPTASVFLPASMGRKKEKKADPVAILTEAVMEESISASGLPDSSKPAKKSRKRAKSARRQIAEAVAVMEEVESAVVASPKKPIKRSYTKPNQGFAALVDSLVHPDSSEQKASKASKPPSAKAGEGGGRSKAKKAKRVKPAESAAGESDVTVTVTEVKLEEVVMKEENGDIEEADEAAEVPKQKKPRKEKPRDPNLPPLFEFPTEAVLADAEKMVPGPRPVPNLGFACLNATLRAQRPAKHAIFSNRDCIKRTYEAKGLPYISELALANCKDLAALIRWNHEHGIRFFRLSSKILPWCTEYKVDELPDAKAISDELAFVGRLARAYDQRLTFHPSHFVKLGCQDGPLLERSLWELEQHSTIFDLMGYSPSVENKINIHIGGMYGDKLATLDRFADNFWKLSPSCQKRLTIENDDWETGYSITDLLPLHKKIGVPLVFDFHHHRFCTGGLSEEEAFKAAVATWPKGIRPVVHWSESQEGRRPSAHSDFVKGPLRLYDLVDKVDVMIEAKGKELALLRLRDPDFKPTAAALAAIGDD